MTQPRGFQILQQSDPAEHSRLARKGGKAAHEKGSAHQWTKEEASEAGRKGAAKRIENIAQRKAGLL